MAKRYITLLLFIFTAFSANAELSKDNLNFYIGIHGNLSWQSFSDKGQAIDNGNTKSSINPSITAGFELNKTMSNNLRFIAGSELFLDYIDKEMVQGDQSLNWDGWILQRPMTGKPIYKTNFLAGARGKAGVRIFNNFDIYGHIGLLYWDRKLYLHQGEDPA